MSSGLEFINLLYFYVVDFCKYLLRAHSLREQRFTSIPTQRKAVATQMMRSGREWSGMIFIPYLETYLCTSCNDLDFKTLI
jgi:hypothetical protein